MALDFEDDNQMLHFTPETLKELANLASKLRSDALFSIEDAGADVVAEQHYLLALSFLETAAHHFTLAQFAQSQALVVVR